MQISFYILQSSDPKRYETFICQLIQKAYRQQHKVTLVTEDLEKWNDLLWSFEPESFLPHGIDDSELPICLTNQAPSQAEVLINLSQAPIALANAKRLLEIFDQPKVEQGRQHYKYYQSLGQTITTHKL